MVLGDTIIEPEPVKIACLGRTAEHPIVPKSSAACLAQAPEPAFAGPLKPFFDGIGQNSPSLI